MKAAKLVGIKETKELLGFVLALGNAAGKSMEDSKFELGEAQNFLPALLKIPEAFGGISNIKAELADLDAEEKAELHSFAVAEFDIPQDGIESVVETALKIGLELYSLIQVFVAAKKA